ncbi:hypothetical protein [Paraliomyxa miuraensis]|uniref:hypothetical protein n=1 Tax=Paraliomyxa miuraensis TaxID=376150 RepID=UPI00225B15EC|nr:hypothetical protein [Paraliomyxa miuraensis]MCX4239754.1 hypothetical protein [Paraliomyxa miuraensis]
MLEQMRYNPIVAVALARMTVAPSASTDGPWPWVLDIFPAVDRHEFWRHLKRLLEPKDKRILIVQGGRQVGKTYTGEYMLAELQRRATGVPIRTVHQRVDGAGSVENVVHGVLGKLGISWDGAPSLDVQQSTDVAAKKEWWIKETARWFADKLHLDRDRQVWLALDGHAKNDAHPELNMLFAELIVQVARRIFDPNGCRLFLIDYPEAIVRSALPQVTLREDITLPTETDVIEFLEGMFGQSPATEARAHEIWARIIQEQEIDRMPMLARELGEVRP